MKTHAIRIHETGGPEVMRWEEIETGPPGPGQVLVRNTAVGLNFIDVYHRSGFYPLPLPLPVAIGVEAAGIVEAAGPKVKEFKIGDRVVAYAMGSYAERYIAPADRLVRIPAGISDQQAAAIMVKGITAHYLIRRTHRVTAGETILVHAAAGGVGLILCQWAKSVGARVIGTVSTAEKAALAKKHGCHYPIVTSSEGFVQRVKAITKGKGVPVVYDSVGKDTFMDSLDCLAPLGLMVSYGNSSGPVAPFPLSLLSQKGSLFVTRPMLVTYAATREDLVKAARELLRRAQKGRGQGQDQPDLSFKKSG
jgi:NADPH2:quinone reductase